MLGVGNAGVEHGHGNSTATRRPVGGDVCPRLWRIHAEGPREVPLQLLPATRRATDAGVVGDVDHRRVCDVVGNRPDDIATRAQSAHPGGNAFRSGHMDDSRDPRSDEPARLVRPRRVHIAHEDLTRDVRDRSVGAGRSNRDDRTARGAEKDRSVQRASRTATWARGHDE